MIALGFVQGWLLIGIACAVLWALWGVLSLIADALDRWHMRERAEWERWARDQPATEGAGKLRKETGSSES